jgi:hypothetical protein
VWAFLGCELDQPSGECTRRDPGGEALHHAGDQQRPYSSAAHKIAVLAAAHEEGGDRHRTATQVIAERPTVSKAPSRPATYKITVSIVTEKPQRSRYSG